MHFILSNDLYAKNGILEDIHIIVKDDGYKSPLCMIDEGFVSSEYCQKVLKNLKSEFKDLCIIEVSG